MLSHVESFVRPTAWHGTWAMGHGPQDDSRVALTRRGVVPSAVFWIVAQGKAKSTMATADPSNHTPEAWKIAASAVSTAADETNEVIETQAAAVTISDDIAGAQKLLSRKPRCVVRPRSPRTHGAPYVHNSSLPSSLPLPYEIRRRTVILSCATDEALLDVLGLKHRLFYDGADVSVQGSTQNNNQEAPAGSDRTEDHLEQGSTGTGLSLAQSPGQTTNRRTSHEGSRHYFAHRRTAKSQNGSGGGSGRAMSVFAKALIAITTPSRRHLPRPPLITSSAISPDSQTAQQRTSLPSKEAEAEAKAETEPTVPISLRLEAGRPVDRPFESRPQRQNADGQEQQGQGNGAVPHELLREAAAVGEQSPSDQGAPQNRAHPVQPAPASAPVDSPPRPPRTLPPLRLEAPSS